MISGKSCSAAYAVSSNINAVFLGSKSVCSIGKIRLINVKTANSSCSCGYFSINIQIPLRIRIEQIFCNDSSVSVLLRSYLQQSAAGFAAVRNIRMKSDGIDAVGDGKPLVCKFHRAGAVGNLKVFA